MNHENKRPPSDDEIDQVLAARVRRTSPEFEMRWRELRAGFTAQPRPRRPFWASWLLWPGLAATVGAAALIIVLQRSPGPTQMTVPITFEELIALDNALQPAKPLLDAESRDALLHLPPQPKL